MQGAISYYNESNVVSSLAQSKPENDMERLRRQAVQIEQSLQHMHAVADRLFGAHPPTATKPHEVAAGQIAELANDLDRLTATAADLCNRFNMLA